jgi:osmotically-inducible protein OsmY
MSDFIRTPRRETIKLMTQKCSTGAQGIKLTTIIASLAVATLAGGMTGCAGDRYTQSTGEHIDDKADSSRVKKALNADTQYKYDDVTVQTFKGVVQLSGFVNSRDQKNRAGDLAKKVEGIKEVQNSITVKESAN